MPFPSGLGFFALIKIGQKVRNSDRLVIFKLENYPENYPENHQVSPSTVLGEAR